jgi:predicted MPP superfamily phosphohydrolase
MKILTIPDIHGKTIWKSVFDPSYDLIVFLGDYVDSFDTPDDIMVQNLKDVISIKNDHPDKVVLLWGNHEMHYLFPGTQFRCSGFRPSIVFEVSPLLIHNKSIFQFAFQYQNYLWTHAGVHRG